MKRMRLWTTAASLALAGLLGAEASAQAVAVTLDVAQSRWGTDADGNGGTAFTPRGPNLFSTDAGAPDASTRFLGQGTAGQGGLVTYGFANSVGTAPENFNTAGPGSDIPAGTTVKLVFDITGGANIQYIAGMGNMRDMTIVGNKLTLIMDTLDPAASASDPTSTLIEAGLGVAIFLDKDNTGAPSGIPSQDQAFFQTDFFFGDIAAADLTALNGAAINADGVNGQTGTFTAFISADYLIAQGINPLSVGASADGMVPEGMTVTIEPEPVNLNGRPHYKVTITNSAWSAHDMQFGQSTGISVINNVIADIGANNTLVKTGAGTLVLTRANTYTGGTTINGGTLQLLNSAAAGTGAITMNGSTLSYGDGIDVANAIVLNSNTSSLAVAAGAAATQSGAISETGGARPLEKTGGGMLTLAGANTYTGDTTLSGGTLNVTGSLTSRVLVGTGTTLMGTGRVAGITVNSGGTLAPGQSIGTLVSTGGTSFEAGSTYAVEIDTAGNADKLDETGRVSIAATGTTLDITGPLTAYPLTSPTYTIIEADGGVAGAFATVQDNLPDLDFVVSYGANTVTLTYTANANDTTPKDVHGAGLAALPGASTTGTLPSVARDALSGDGMRLSTQGYMAQTARGGGRRGWGQLLGAIENAGATGTIPGWQANTGGLMVGADFVLGDGASVAGVALAYTDTSVDSGGSTADVNGLHLAAYGGYRAGPFALTGSFGVGFQDYRFVRRFNAAGAAQRATGDTNGTSLAGAVEMFYDAATAAGWSAPSSASAFSFGPVARLLVASGRYDGFTETGAGILNLAVADTSVTQIRSVLGLSGAMDMDLGQGRRLRLDGELGWEHVFQGRSVTTASTIGVAGAAFSTGSAPIDSDRVAFGLGAAYAVSDRTTLTLRYDGRVGSRSSDHRASAGLSIAF